MLQVNPYHVLQHLFGVSTALVDVRVKHQNEEKKNMISVTICGTDAECWFEYFGNGWKFHTNQTVVRENPRGFTKRSN